MDLEIRGRRAIGCASSRGLGRACAEALAAEGVDVVINEGTAADVHATAEAIREAHQISESPVVADVATADGRAVLLAACPDPDISISNNRGPQSTPFGDIDGALWLRGLQRQSRSGTIVGASGIAKGDGQTVRSMVRSPRPHMDLS